MEGNTVVFNFEEFSKRVAVLYTPGPYTIVDTLQVFEFYFSTYEKHFGRPHPNIKSSQIVGIMAAMPFFNKEDQGGSVADIMPEFYRYLILRYFNTRYRHCDYNINHFFSGRIRELRYFELQGGR